MPDLRGAIDRDRGIDRGNIATLVPTYVMRLTPPLRSDGVYVASGATAVTPDDKPIVFEAGTRRRSCCRKATGKSATTRADHENPSSAKVAKTFVG